MDDERTGTTNPVSTRRALSRRHFLAGVTATAGAAILAACGGASSATNTPKSAGATNAPAGVPTSAAAAATTAPATSGSAVAPTTAAAAPTTAAAAGGKGKSLKMSRNAEPFSPLIPWQIDDNPALFISVNMYDTLLRTTKDGLGVEPGLATKWESSADSLTWTFTIRDGLKFSDGTAVKGDDFVTSLKQVSQGTKSAWKDNYKAIKDVQAPDDKTVKVILSQPHAPILSELAMFCAAILPADMAKASDADGFDATKSRGTGAYALNGWKKGEPLVLTRNPNYWKGTPTVDTVTVEFVPDDNARILKLQGGETDVIDFVPLSQLASLGQQPNVKTQAFVIQQFDALQMNITFKPLDDVKVRQALNYALDKEAILKAVYFGQAKFMNSPIPPGTYYDKTLPGYPFSLDKAKQLMAASSVPSGFTVDYTIPSGNNVSQQVATIAKDQWSKIGVTVNILQQESSVRRQSYKDGKLAITTSGWTNDMNDPTEIVNYEMRGGASPFAIWTRYNNPDLNTKITAADLEQDPKKREADYAEIQKIYLDAAPLVFISYPPATAAWQKYVDGFFIDGLSYYRFEDVKVNK
ncbi:MAG: ABC transporter substrate-binding protein [Chloroflexota bacterium]|nr:ABC transporter substrate-binding protein [Chloroflexota bacterium]